jgi:hypothetical protein
MDGVSTRTGEMPWDGFGRRLENTASAGDAARVSGISEVELFSFFDPVVKAAGVRYGSAGKTNDGREVWAIVRLGEDSEIALGDAIGRYVLLAHATASTRVPSISCRPVRLISSTVLRDNLLYPLTRVVRNVAEPQLEEPPDLVLEKLRLHFDQLARQFRLMASMSLGWEQLQEYLERVFPNPNPARNQRHREMLAERPRALAECARLFVEGKGNDLPDVRRSLWAAYNAVAQYVDYCQFAEYDPKRLNHVFGSPLKAYAMRQASRLVPAH